MPLFYNYDVITIGGSTEDISMNIDDYHLITNRDQPSGNPLLAFDYGTKVRVSRSVSTFGGGATNTAVCLSLLGLRVAGMISYGSDERGKRIVDNLKKNKVDTSLMKKIISEVSGFSFIAIGDDNEHVAFSYRAANNFLEINKRDISKLSQTKWLFLTSMTGSWKSNLDNIFAVPKVKVAWNPGEEQLDAGFKALKKYLAKTTVLSMNKDEAIKLILSHPDHSSSPYDFLTSSVNLLKVMRGWGPDIVVVTNGPHGADAYDGTQFYYQPVIVSKHKEDTTGLGDAFGSSFIAGLEIFAGDVKKSLYLGAKNASSVISALGAQNGLLTRSDIKPLFDPKFKWK